ncbi:MAG TPA: hypothetical protein VJC04_03585, partial [Candidatus Paceibacterota bacterium]
MKLMQYDRIARKYHLLWHSNQKSIIVQIHNDCVKSFKPVSIDSPWVRAMSQTHDADGLLDSFCGDLSSDYFGFNRSIKRTGQSGDYLDFSVPVPEIKKETGAVCQECGATGKREGFEICHYCDGSGKMYVYDWRTAYLVTSNLSLLFDTLDLCDETSAKEYQYVTVTMMAQYGQHGSSLGGCFGIDFNGFINQDSMAKKLALTNAVEAMRTAYDQMMICQDYDRFRVNADNGFLTLDCPGDACGIYLTHHDGKAEQGCQFSCHNVDSPAQSLTLLAGIASLVGQAN